MQDFPIAGLSLGLNQEIVEIVVFIFDLTLAHWLGWEFLQVPYSAQTNTHIVHIFRKIFRKKKL